MHAQTCTCTCIYHSQNWLCSPHSVGEPAGDNKTGGPIGSGGTSLIFPAALPVKRTKQHMDTHARTHTHTPCMLPTNIIANNNTYVCTYTVHTHSLHMYTPTIYSYDAYLLFTGRFTFHLISHRHWMFICVLQKHNKVVKFCCSTEFSFEEEMSLLLNLMLRRHAMCLLSHLNWLWPLRSYSIYIYPSIYLLITLQISPKESPKRRRGLW